MVRILLFALLWSGILVADASVLRELNQVEIADFLHGLEAIRRDSPGRKLDFREERHSRLFREPVVAKGTIWFAPPARFRREVQPPDASTTISNGRKLWLFYPDFQEVEEYDLEGSFPFSREMELLRAGLTLEDLERFFRIRAWTDDEDSVVKMDLRPRGGGRSGIEQIIVHLGESATPQKLEILSRDGTRSTLQVLQDSPFTPAAGFFEATIPNGWNVSRPLDRQRQKTPTKP